jgi:tetratricopeptide (TPR) repeat protein
MGQGYALLGDIARTQGRYAEALTQYQECLSLWRDRENIMNTALVLDSVAQTLSRMGDLASGAALLSAAAAIRERASVKLAAIEQANYDETLRACRVALGEAGLAAAWATGHTLTLAQAINLALQPLAPVGSESL